MNIIVRDVEEAPEQALESAPGPAPELPEAAPEPALPEPAAVAKKKGRPLGSKDDKPRAKRPQIIEEAPTAPCSEARVASRRAKVVVYDDNSSESPPPKRQVSRARAPAPATPVQVAASMLEILRQEQAARVERKSQLYRSWVQ